MIFKLIIAGSRDITDYETVRKAVECSGFFRLHRHRLEIVSGCAKGVDKLAIDFAKRNGLVWYEFPADWQTLDVPGAVVKYDYKGRAYNARAGHARNEAMAKFANGLCAVWDGVSTGTKDMIQRAYDHDLDVFVYNLKERND